MVGSGPSDERLVFPIMEPLAYRVGDARRPVVGFRTGRPKRILERDATGDFGASSNSFRLACRRRRVARWAVLAGMLLYFLMLASFGLSARDDAFSGPVEPVLAIEVGSLLAPPQPHSLDMGRVWTAARARDPWPSLVADGRTGTAGGKVSLTFDDGPDPTITPRVLDTLREQELKATFFVVGRQVAKHPDLLRRIVREGHTLGNHTYSHSDMADLAPARMRWELRSTQRAVDDALGYHYEMSMMRPPYGSPYFDGPGDLPVFQKVVRGQGLFVVTWTVDPRDYLFDGQPESVLRRVARADRLKKREGDEVLLLHDTKPQTAEALPEIIAHYQSLGLRFASVEELLADKYAGS